MEKIYEQLAATCLVHVSYWRKRVPKDLPPQALGWGVLMPTWRIIPGLSRVVPLPNGLVLAYKWG